MKIIKPFLFLAFLASTYCFSQQKDITLQDIYGGTFRAERMDALHSMANGQQYSVLDFDRKTGTTSVDIYDYETLKKVKTLVNSSKIDELQYFVDYTFSKDEKQILLATDVESIYRHSTLGKYYVFDVETGKVTLVSEEKIQEPAFSPNGNKVAYGFENNLYVKDLVSGETEQITTDGEKNKIINGITDWVYEEEFAFVRAFQWNADGNKLAYIRFDESQVPEFSMDVFGSDLYPSEDTFKYPKAGEKNSEISLHFYDLDAEETYQVPVNREYSDYYIPRIKWTNNPDVLSAQYMNRHQNELDLWMLDATKKTSKLVLEERDKAYVDVTDNLTFLDDNSFIWTSEKDGYNHIYHYDKNGKLVDQVTKGNWEVTHYYGYDEKTDRIFYQSVENGSINRDVYSIKLNGRNKQRLSSKTGTNNASFSADFSYYINTFSNTTTPSQYTLNDATNGKVLKTIKDNKTLAKKVSEYNLSKKEFSTLNINGYDLNMWMIKPANFDESKQYPLFMYQYSGPGSQNVINRWNGANDYWFQMLAQKGYIVACIDGRGTGLKGSDFKKMTQKELGKYEVEDQIASAKKLGQRPYIDADRIGIFGWSYGGFMASNCIFRGGDAFKMAIAVAPVTNWRFYDTIYTERYMTTPQENPDGYDKNSPLTYASDFNDKEDAFLLVHGSADDNVHYQNTMRLVEALVQANKQFEWLVYPDKNHGIYGGNTRIHLYKKMTDFILENL